MDRFSRSDRLTRIKFDMNWSQANKDDVIARFSDVLLPIDTTDGTENVKREGQRVAAVMALLVERASGWNIILTQRPETMPSHPGQISFPGGKREGGESIQVTALRETEEEIGVKPVDITLIGRLPSFDAVSEYRITPFIGLLEGKAKLIANPGEVEDIFEVPLSFLMDDSNHKPRDIFFDGKEHRLIDLPYESPDGTHRNIWGMTAMMIYRLYERLYVKASTI